MVRRSVAVARGSSDNLDALSDDKVNIHLNPSRSGASRGAICCGATVMPKVVSSNEAKQRWGSLLAYVSEQGDEVVVESDGKPAAVLMPIAAYEEVKALREAKRRAEILDRLRPLEERQAVLNQDLSEEDAMALAVRFSREMIDDLAAEGKISFERDRR